MNDCGVIADADSSRELAHFGYCSVGWQVPAQTAESLGSLVGVEIVRLLGLPLQLNTDYAPAAATLLLADIPGVLV